MLKCHTLEREHRLTSRVWVMMGDGWDVDLFVFALLAIGANDFRRFLAC